MNWSKGYTASHYASIIDSKTWKDIRRIELKEGGSINRSSSDSLIESADIECEYVDETFFNSEKWIRIYANIVQDEGSYHGALFTGLICSPSKNINGPTIENNVQCYSVLKPAEDVLLDRGWYISAGSDAVAAIKNLLSITPAPISVDGISGKILENIVAEENETCLSMAWKLLNMMNWRIAIDGNGLMRLCSYPILSNNIVKFDAVESDSLELPVQINYDWFNCPNVFRAVSNTAIAVAKDENPESPLSIQNRGREVWKEETNCALKTNESLGEYAKRRLKEEQDASYELSYTRRYHPNVNVSDIIRLNYPAQKIIGFFRVNNQSIRLGHSISVSEDVIKME